MSEVLSLTVTSPTVTPLPLTATLVAPLTKCVPVSVSETVVPDTAVAGAIAVSVGAGGTTVKGSAGLVPPLAVVIVSVRGPSAASAAIASVAAADVALWTCTPLTAIPSPLTATAVVSPATKAVPAIRMGIVVPWTPVAGVTVCTCGRRVNGPVGV